MAKRSGERDAARAEYVARRERGEEVNLRQFAEERGIKYDTLRRWKSADRWEEQITKKRGAQPGNKNAKGNPGGGAPAGNSNAEKEGAYSAIFYENLSPAEKQIVENAPTNSTALTSHEIGILLLREKYIIDKISEYRALPPDTMYNKETPDQRITQLQEALNKIHGRILTAAAQMQKNEMDALRLELEKQRLEIMRMRATGEISDGKEDDEDDAVHE